MTRALSVAALLLAACEATEVHIFAARRYVEASDCLVNTAGVDVIAGPDLGACDRVRCWVSPGTEVYVTDLVCDAPPEYAEGTTDMTGPCVKALEAYRRKGHGRCHLEAREMGDGGG